MATRNLRDIVEICDNFKYLGITFDCKLKWSNHCTLIVSKCKQRLFFLRLLNSFGVKNDILHVFYTSMIESIIRYNISLWWSSMNKNDKKALNRIIKQAANVTQSELSYIDDFYCNIVTQKVKCIMANSCHALHDYCNDIVRRFVRRAINSAQSPIGRNIAVIRHRYAICVVDINVKHVHRQYPSSLPELSGTARCILELLCVSNNETYLPGSPKVKLIL